MNPIVRWFHMLGSPPYFHRFASRWAPVFLVLSLLCGTVGLYQGLFVVPADYQQGDSFRIIYIHVPAASMSMAVYAAMAVYSAIGIIWHIKLAEILAMACAPIGAMFTAVTLVTGSIWGKPMWGTWWVWDPRLTTELLLLFLYFGVMALYNAIEDRRAAARAAGFLSIVGVVLLPIIKYSVEWWNSLHQGSTFSVFGQSKMDPSMTTPIIWMFVAVNCWFVASLLRRARAENLRREADKRWAQDVLETKS